MIRGAMQHWPLRVGTIIDHAERQHGTREVVTRAIYHTVNPRLFEAQIAYDLRCP